VGEEVIFVIDGEKALSVMANAFSLSAIAEQFKSKA